MLDAPDLDGAPSPCRRLPHNIEAEMALLGAILVNKRAYECVSDFLLPEHFALLAHRRIFDGLRRLADQGKLADAVTMKSYLDNAGALDEVGGTAYISQLTDYFVPPSSAGDYGRLIYELALRREMIATAEDVFNRAYNWSSNEGGLDDLRGAAEALQATVARMSGPRGLFEPEDLADLLAEDIEPRHWLLGTLLCRKYLTVLAASGGTGKTSLAIMFALSLATGRPLIGLHVHKPCRVLLLTYEDGREEYQRRFAAACLHYNLHAGDIKGRILIRSLAGAEGAKTLAEVSESGGMQETGTAEQVAEIIRRQEVDVVMMDPFIKCSGAPENDNMAVDFVARILTRLAENENVAVHVLHHFRKGTGQPGDINSARGARSLIDAARIGCTLQPMTSEEATTFGVSEDERRRLVRLDDGKANLAPLSAARWFRLASVNIGNATPEYPSGDDLQVVEAWTPPETWAGLSINDLNRILDEIDGGLPNGERYSDAAAAKDRAAWEIVQRHAPGKTDKQCRKVIATWVKNGVLKREEYWSQKERKSVQGLKVNPLKRPGTIHD